MKPVNKTRIANPIAERRFSVVGEPAREVVVTIGKPRPDPSGDWRCSFRIRGISDDRRRVARGLDALQALLLAVEGAREALAASDLVLLWEGGEAGDTGLPRTVPQYYGLDFARKIERYIDRETQKFAQAAKTRAGSDDKRPNQR